MYSKERLIIIQKLIFSFFGLITTVVGKDMSGPEFDQEPPDHVDFSSLSGAAIHCSATGVPRPSIKWLQADGNLVLTSDKLRRVVNNGSLIFLSFQSEDYRPDVHATVYRCIASNTAGSIVSREVHVKAVVPHPPDIQVYSVPSIIGNTAVLKCHLPAILSDYVRVTSWLRDGKLWIDATSPEVMSGKYQLMSDGSLHVMNVDMTDSGLRYQCKAANKLTGEVYLSTPGNVFVTAPQGNVLPEVIDSKTSLIVKEEEPIIVPCASQGYPLPNTKWYRKIGEQLHPLLTGDRLQKTGSGLRIKNVQFSDSGIYVCDVSNDVGNKRVETSLTVMGKLHAEIQPEVQIVDLGAPVTITCSVSGNPISSVRWIHNGKWLPINDTHISTSSNMHIAEVTLADKGMYQCFVGNSLQSVQATAELRLHDIVPRFIETFSEKVLPTRQSISLKCVVFGLPTPQITWTVDYNNLRKSNNSHIEERVDINGNTVSVIHIQNSIVKDAGLYQCQASNKAGKIMHSAKINIHGPPFGRQVPKQVYVEGSTVFIHCPVYGHPIQVYQWEKDRRLLPINLRQAVYQNGTLVIEKMKKNVDAGMYTCSAWNKGGQRAEVTVVVDVSVPPKITPFSFQDKQIREGMRARLQCVVSDGDLPIRIMWLKDGQDIDPELGVSIRDLDEFSSILTINKINPRNNGNYTCVASNSAGSAHHAASLYVNVPPQWLLEPKDTSVALNSDAALHCQAEGSPYPAITWMKADSIQPGTHKEIITTTSQMLLFHNGSLLMKNVQASDEGVYICQATNGIDEGLSIVVHLYVNVPPQVNATNNSIVTKINQNLTLSCEVFGDEQLNLSWSKNSNIIPVTRSSRYRIQTFTSGKTKVSELIIQSAHREDSTIFTCLARNEFGVDSANISVTVQEPPDPVKKIKAVDPTSRSVEITWNEPFDGNSPILGYTIEYKAKDPESGKSLQPKNGTVGPNEYTYILNDLKPATPYEITLFSHNKLGQSNSSHVVEFTTAEEAPSAPPQDVSVTSVDMRTVKVTWKPPKQEFHNGKLRGYRVGYKVQSMNDPLVYKLLDISNGSRKELSLTVSNLKKFTIYEFVVEAYNEPGIGPASEPILATTAEDVPSVPPVDIRCSPLSSKSINLSWQPPPPMSINGILQGYKISYKATDEWHAENLPQRNITIKDTKHLLEGLRKFTNYSMQVSAFTKAGNGAISKSIYCRTFEDFPEAPAAIIAAPASETSIIVSWKAPILPNGILTQYDVYVRKVHSPTKVTEKHKVPPSSNFYEVKDLSSDYRYEFWVTASTSVGEGKATKVVTQHSDSHLVPAKIISFGEKVTSMWNSNITLPCHSVGSPIVDLRWYIRGKPIKRAERHFINQDGSLSIYLLKGEDAGSYSCSVKNEHGKAEIVYDIQVLEPPHPPQLSVPTTTFDSIEIKWTPGKNGGLPLQEYILQYKAEDSSLWERRNISNTINKFKIERLKCGTKYNITMAGINTLGIGVMSPSLLSSTDGGVPLIPEKDKLIEEGQNWTKLHLSSWISNGCSIQNFTIAHRAKNSKEWIQVTDTIKPSHKHYVITSLQPATWYVLRMSAFNSAGRSPVQYEFATLTLTGGTIAPEFAADEGFIETKGLLSEWDRWIIIAAASSIVALLSILIITCLCVKHKKRHQQNERGAFHAGEKRNLCIRDNSEMDFAYLRGNPERTRFAKLHSRMDKRNDFLPYATPHLANHEMTMFTSHTLLPPEPDVGDNSAKEDRQTLPRFAKPKPYQSGFRTPTHDPCNRGMRMAHPVPIPTAPPIVDNSFSANKNLKLEPTNGKSHTPVKSSGKQTNRLKRNMGNAEETAFAYPASGKEQNATSTTSNHVENIYENVPPSEGPPCPSNIPSRPKLTMGLGSSVIKRK